MHPFIVALDRTAYSAARGGVILNMRPCWCPQEKEASLPSEPDMSEGDGVTLCAVRLPDGTRPARRFRQTDPLQLLFDFVDAKVGANYPPWNLLLRWMQARRFTVQLTTDRSQGAGSSSPFHVICGLVYVHISAAPWMLKIPMCTRMSAATPKPARGLYLQAAVGNSAAAHHRVPEAWIRDSTDWLHSSRVVCCCPASAIRRLWVPPA